MLMYSLFPQDAPRSRNTVISESYGKRIISYLKGNSDDDKHFHHMVKRSGFRLLDFPEAAFEMRWLWRQGKKGSYCRLFIVFDLATDYCI